MTETKQAKKRKAGKAPINPEAPDMGKIHSLLFKRKRKKKHSMRTTFSVSTNLPKVLALETAIEEGKGNPQFKFVNDYINEGLDLVIEKYGLNVPSDEEAKKIIEENPEG